MATKYTEYYQLMLKQNAELFDQFRAIHAKYEKDPNKYQNEFNQVGYDVQDVVGRFENMLCSQTEGSGKGKFSSALAEKFQAEIKKEFPKYNQIGMILD
jgi:hypothetical protein